MLKKLLLLVSMLTLLVATGMQADDETLPTITVTTSANHTYYRGNLIHQSQSTNHIISKMIIWTGIRFSSFA